jgi:hypothetical protein
LEGGVRYFEGVVSALECRAGGPFRWRQERDEFINAFTKLVNQNKQNIPHKDTTFEDLGSLIAEAISSNAFAEVVNP